MNCKLLDIIICRRMYFFYVKKVRIIISLFSNNGIKTRRNSHKSKYFYWRR